MDLSNVQITQDCIVTMTHWGKDIITNVCNGKVTEVAWGFVNYLNYSLSIFAGVIATGLLIFLVIIFLLDK